MSALSGQTGTASMRLVQAGTYCFDVGDAPGGLTWHSHELHQIEYAFEGMAQVETATARYLLPPQQAIWIPAGVEHCTTLRNMRGVTVFFDPSMGIPAGDRVRVLPAAPVIREMILYGARWPLYRPSTSDTTADIFFQALARVVVEWLDHETPLYLPSTSDPLVAAAINYTRKNLASVTFPEVCAAVGASERSLRRAFLNTVGISWRQYLISKTDFSLP